MTEQVDLDALEALAKAATPGPWEAGESEFFDEHEVMSVLARRVPVTWDDHSGDVFAPADARFIAAADPSTVLALIAELRQERERADAYRIMQRETAKTAREMRAESDAALSRAEKTIERVGRMAREDDAAAWYLHQPLIAKLTEYGRAKREQGDAS